MDTNITPTPKPVNPLSQTKFVAKQALLVAVVSIVVAIAAIVLATLNWQSSIAKNEALETAIKNNIKIQAMTTTLSKQWQNQHEQIHELQTGLVKLGDSKHVQFQKTLAEVTYFIHLANLHLTLSHDKTVALHSLVFAQERLAPIQSVVFLPLKQSLAADIQKLNETPTVDTNKIFKELIALNEAIQQISPLPEHPHQAIAQTTSREDAKPWYDRFLDSMKGLKDLFVIRQINHPTMPLIATKSVFYLRENVSLKLNIAQWALLHHDRPIYLATLKEVQQWLSQYYATSLKIKPVLSKLKALEKINIDPKLPSLENTLRVLSKTSIKPYVPEKKQPAEKQHKTPPKIIKPVPTVQKPKTKPVTKQRLPLNTPGTINKTVET